MTVVTIHTDTIDARRRARCGGEPPDPPDSVLVRRARGGDADAFAVLDRRFRRLVTSVIAAEVRGGARAPDLDDLAQDVFTVAWVRLASLRDPSRFRPWLLQIARRAVIDHGRRMSRRSQVDGGDLALLADVAEQRPGPAEIYEADDLARRVRRSLSALPLRDSTAIVLSADHGLGHRELAHTLGTSPGNARVVLCRARARLRELTVS